MKKSSRSENKSMRLWKTQVLLVVLVIWLFLAGIASAQNATPVSSPTQQTTTFSPQPVKSATGEKSATANNAASTSADPAHDYKASLDALSNLYKSDVEKLELKSKQMKELFDQGLISRRDLEASDQALADARGKVEETARQIAEANKPAPTIASDALSLDSNGIAPAWTTGNIRIDGLINYYGKQYSVDPYLVYCLMSQESKFTSGAISPKGAQGLMQLMPGTAARYGVTNPYDVGQSIMGGTRYLKDLLKMFNGRVDLALAGYNAGENAVIKYGYTVPPYDETRNYVKLIIKRYGAKKPNTQSAKS